MRNKNGFGIDFKPTKTWKREHHKKPPFCDITDVPCYCVMDWCDKNEQGFCVGLREVNDPDIINVCINFYNEHKGEMQLSSFAMHPNEALWFASNINLAVLNAWSSVKEYRKVVSDFGRQRTRILNNLKKTTTNEQRHSP